MYGDKLKALQEFEGYGSFSCHIGEDLHVPHLPEGNCKEQEEGLPNALLLHAHFHFSTDDRMFVAYHLITSISLSSFTKQEVNIIIVSYADAIRCDQDY